MLKYSIIILIFCRLSIVSWGEEINITIENTKENTAILLLLQGEKVTFVDSLFSDKIGRFIYNSKNLSMGFYQIKIYGKSPITFLYTGNDVVLKADAESIDETIEVVKSESNEIYYDFVNLNRDYKIKIELLRLILARYPKNDEYYQTTLNKASQIQKEYIAFIDSVVSMDSSSLISRYVRSSQLPIVNFTLPIEEQISFLKSHTLDKVDFGDAELIYSDCFTNKSIEYLMYYQNPQLPKGLLEKEFQNAVDTLLTRASVNILVYEHIADYLVDGFKQFGFDNVVDYIVENYVVKDDLCLDELTENSIENRINQSNLLKVGATAPNIILQDTSGNMIDLSKIEKEKVLLLFYATWCPHCQDMLPEIHKVYKQRKDFEVVAISLDENRDDWINYLRDNSFEWIDLSDLNGWESKAAQDYFIYATPTMFLLDQQRIILGKPITLKELSDLL
ncbi:MAG: thioredoxin-like domain-containing protein [Melioribacteraceae bacterium]|nr:MAG: thioredoxin-like domain-containing protein [Melioribacteraceae bacterium]